MRIILLNVVALLVISGIVVTAEAIAEKSFAFDTAGLVDEGIRVMILAAMTYLGIIGQVVSSQLKKAGTNPVSIRGEIARAVRTADFWLAVIASPLILMAAYSAITQITSYLLIAGIGFQNGFFFHSILRRQESAAPKGD